MDSCCQDKTSELEALRGSQSKTLWAVLGINGGMFGVELAIGLLAGSTALLADSLDMLGDALVYGFSLYVVTRSDRWRASAALLKGIIMAAFGLVVLAQAGYHLVSPEVPDFRLMASTGALALAANVTCLCLLTRHRKDDLNMRSTWLCSRNDIIANAGVLVAAASVFVVGSSWPDLIVGFLIMAVFMRSAVYVMRQSITELRRPEEGRVVSQGPHRPIALLVQRCEAGTCPSDACRCGTG
jgi:cation diffusion facilitator family transporter